MTHHARDAWPASASRRFDLAQLPGRDRAAARRTVPGAPPRCAALFNKVFPDHWSFLLGEIALYSFIVLLLTGTFLALFFDPSMAEVPYNGSYTPAARDRDDPGVRDVAEPVVRRPRRPDHAADAPLGGAAVHGRDRRPHVPDLLHRRLPQAARG